MLTLEHVRLRRGTQVLIEDGCATVFRGEKVGIVGRNGCGKSSLLALVRGELGHDGGNYGAPPGLAIASVAQELPGGDTPLKDYILKGDEELDRLLAQIAADDAADGARTAALHEHLAALGGYAAASRAAQLAAGLGFENADLTRPVNAFSGGLRMRANLARALMRRSDLLLLDEPTNHLDLDALLWLERWLVDYRGTLLLVSHDREFLDRIVTRVLHLEQGRLTSYSGNYSDFERQHAAAAERSAALSARQRREAAHIESFVARFRAQASKARQVQSRLKWLARLPELAQVHAAADFEWQFASPARMSRPLLTLEGAAAGYGGRTVLAGVSLSLAPGDRLGVLGRNGAGKSTLMRLIAGELTPLAGERTPGDDLACGFFAQLELEQLDADRSALQELARRGGAEVARWTQQQLRDHLGRFGFGGARVLEPTRHFSGGERSRLALAILVARRPNLLLLDEPTNHLDLAMRHSLLLALQDFEGAVVVVSHDRALLRGACDRFVLVAQGGLVPFEGDLEDYAAWLSRAGEPADPQPAAAGPSRREERRQAAAARARLAPLRGEQQALEARLAALTRERSEIEMRLSDPVTYAAADAATQRNLSLRHGELAAEIERTEASWLAVSEALEAAAG